MIDTKYYGIADLIKVSGLSGNELRYLISKNKIEHKVIRTRKYFSKNDITKILIQGKQLYSHTKNQRTYVDQTYKVDNLIKKLYKLRLKIENIILK